MPEENDNESSSEEGNNTFKNVLGKWNTRASISSSEGNLAYIARIALKNAGTTTGNPQEDHDIISRRYKQPRRRSLELVMQPRTATAGTQDDLCLNESFALLEMAPPPLETPETPMPFSPTQFRKQQADFKLMNRGLADSKGESSEETTDGIFKEEASSSEETSLSSKYKSPNKRSPKKVNGVEISRLSPSSFTSKFRSPKRSPKKKVTGVKEVVSPSGHKAQHLGKLFGTPLTHAAAIPYSSPGQYSPGVSASPVVDNVQLETPQSWREKLGGGGIPFAPLTTPAPTPNTPTESSENDDHFENSQSPSAFMKARQKQKLGIVSPRLLNEKKKKPRKQTWMKKAPFGDDDEGESTVNDDDDNDNAKDGNAAFEVGEISLNDDIAGDGTMRSRLGSTTESPIRQGSVRHLAVKFNKQKKEETSKDEVPKAYGRQGLRADRQVDNTTSGEDGETSVQEDSAPSASPKSPSRRGGVNNLAGRFQTKLTETEKPTPESRRGGVKDLVNKRIEEQEMEKQEEAGAVKLNEDKPADKPVVSNSVGALAKKWEIKGVQDNPRSTAKSRRPQEQGLNKEDAKKFSRQESARKLMESDPEPATETVKETVKQQPIRMPMKKPAEDGKCSGNKEEDEVDPDNRRARLKANKSDLHDFRRKLQATKSGIARKTEEVRAPLIATTGEFKPPVFAKEQCEEQLIRKALKKNFVFGDLDDDALDTFIDAFEGIEIPKRQKIIDQGDKGDYFYVIARGKVSFGINGVLVGTATEGTSFGELALLYTCPRAATVMASAETKLFRVDQKTFRHIMESKAKQMEELKLSLLHGISFLKDLVESDLKRLSSVMFPRIFDTGEYLIKKGDAGDAFYILYEGSVKVTKISIGNTSYEDVTLEPGDHFGEMSLVTSAVRAANVITLSKGTAFSIDRETFEKILGKFSRVILKAQDRRKLEGIKILRDARLEPTDFMHLRSLLADKNARKNDVVIKEGDEARAALYLVREGSVEISTEDGSQSEVVEAGGYFGDEQLLADAHGEADDWSYISVPYTVTVLSEKCYFGVLTLEDCRTVFDTKLLDDEVNQGPCPEIMKKRASVRDSVRASVSLTDLNRHSMLGEGLFGQVWLVRAESMGLDPEGDSSGNFALKVQSKDSSTRADAAEAIKREMSVVQQLNHPFIVDLVHSYEDEDSVYMLMSVVTGGELWNVIHKEDDEGDWTSGIPEEQAKFYALIIADTLTYIHYQCVVYRDMKPENVLIDSEGYPIIVDFGFAKHCPDKTYTFCGTPNYLAPEIVMNRGHSFGVDHWALGIVIYEMITGENPFYYDGMDQMSLFEAIVKEEMYPLSDDTTEAAFEVIDGLLQKDSIQRLGMLAGREKDILTHRWFEGINLTDMRAKKIKAPWIPP